MKKEKTISFENWKSGRHIVLRNEKGYFITYRKQKGSGIKTFKQALEIFNKTGTFNPKSIRVGKKRVKTKKDILSRTKIGKNTFIIRSNKPLENEKYYQHVTKIYWGNKRRKTIGYSNMRGTKAESIKRAIYGAIKAGIIDYEWVVDIDNGVAYPPETNKKSIKFELVHQVATYVKEKR